MSRNLIKQINKDIGNILNDDLPWDRFSNSKILITGASGFIGNYLVRVLLELNKKELFSKPLTIYAMARDEKKFFKKFNDLVSDDFLQFFKWDLNSFAVPPYLDFNYIFHAASNATPKFYETDPVGTILPNTVGTAFLLDILRKSKSKDINKGFIFLSSSEIYGQNISIQSQKSFTENDENLLNKKSFRSCYSDSKKMGETICKAWNDQYNIPTYIARIFHTYGPGLSREDGRVFSDFIFNILDNLDVEILGTGEAKRSYCYISDTIRAIFRILLKGKNTELYDVGNPNAEMSVIELANMLVNLYPEKKLKIKKPNFNKKNLIKKEFNVISPNIDKLLKIGWNPKVPPSEGFKKTIDCQSS